MDIDEKTNTYIVEFKDIKNIIHRVKVSEKAYEAFDKFELEDISQINKIRKHIERNEVYKETLFHKSINASISVEDEVESKLLNEEHLEYVTPYLAELLGIQKDNNPYCFIRPNQNTIYSLDTGKIAKVILYVRLSVEDLEKSDGNVSKSILNQLLMLLAYCQEHNLKVVGKFYEEDISGADENRPEWNKSLTFCELGYANTYICKTQARFARSIEMVQKFLYRKVCKILTIEQK